MRPAPSSPPLALAPASMQLATAGSRLAALPQAHNIGAHHTIPTCYALAFLRGARSRGVDVAALMARHGMSAAIAASRRSRVSLAQFSALLADLRRRMHDEFLGFASRPVKLGTFALAARGMIRCGTLREALELGTHTYRLAVDDFRAHLRVRADMASIELRPYARLPYAGFIHSAFLYWTATLASWLVQERIPVLHASLTIPEPESQYLAQGPIFDVSMTFHAPRNGIGFPAAWLQRRIVADERLLQDLLARLPGALLVRFRDRQRLGERVRLHLQRQLPQGLPSLEQLAWEMHMSPHLLRRRLAEENTSFQAIKNALRRDAAIELLVRSDLCAADIAQCLGFSEPSTFHRSFKLWTGVAPGEYRRQHGEHGKQP